MNKIYAALVIVMGLITIVISSMSFRFAQQTSKKNDAYLQNITEAQEKLSEMIHHHADESMEQFTSLSMEGKRNKDETIIGILVEKTKYDYVEQGLNHYGKRAYSQAYNAFSRALSYDGNDTTILFYKIYCLYLISTSRSIDEDTYRIISDGLQVINRKGYQKNELLDFTEEWMREMTAYMAVNISGWKKDYGE